MGEEFGSDATVNVGVRNDDYGTGFESDFSDAWEAAGGTIGEKVEWNPDAPTFDTEAQTVGQRGPRRVAHRRLPRDVREGRTGSRPDR